MRSTKKTDENRQEVAISSGGMNAYKVVLRYLLDSGMQTGEQLPGHDRLRNLLNLGNNTLSEAIQLMNRDGVVVSKRRCKTVLADVTRASIPLFNIGLMQTSRIGGIYAIYNFFIREALIHHHCRPLSFILPDDCHSHPELRQVNADEIQGLAIAMEHGELDTVISVSRLENLAVPLYEFGPSASHWGLKIDIAGMILDAVQLLRERGCQRIMAISTAKTTDREHLETMLTGTEIVSGPTSGEDAVSRGMMIAAMLLKRPDRKRPDGIICSDDHIAQGLTAGLGANSDWSPTIAVRVNKHLGLSYFLPIIPLILDAEELAKTVASTLFDDLMGRKEKQLAKVAYHTVGPVIPGVELKL